MTNAGENTTEIVARLKRDLLPTLTNGIMYWPICDFITFRFTPVHLQVCVSFPSLLFLFPPFCVFACMSAYNINCIT